MNKRRAFYLSKQWRKVRNSYMNSVAWICERCYSTADIVHHKEYINDENISNPAITLDWENLEALCIDCHNKEHFKTGVISNELFFDDEGNVRKQI